MDPQLFCLRWNNHQTNLLSVFDQLLQVEAFCDVTLAVDGASLKCHKMVLAACSNYFQNLFMENTCKHPIVFLKDITFNQIRALLDYMYHGEVSVQEEELPALLKIAEALKVKGLVESDDKEGKQSPSSIGPNVTSSNIQKPSSTSKLPIWPVSTNKLLSPKAKSESGYSNHGNPTDEDPGTLIIDEESNEGGNITMSPLDADYDMNYLNDDTPPAPGMVKTIGPNGKVEWKRYKQYTKDDILAAIEEVKAGMSALQASRKYGVPSRTLYDKVKKMGILTANMQKQLQQKKASECKPDNQNFPPISLLGMQLPQSGLPQIPLPADRSKHNGNTPPFSSAMMLSMIEKMKAAAGAKPPLGGTPLNLSAMLDSSGQESGDESRKSSESSKSSDEAEIKEENNHQEPDIRAQFFADLKRFNDSKGETLNQENNHQTSVIKSLNEFSNGDASTHSVTLKVREGEETLPHRKRKYSHENNLTESHGDCKKLEEDLEPAIKLETTSY